ncbi:MAG: Nucleolar protein 16 [Peltula sp. TS41687]|nr:MAG: Nucleolar protein 16 [Peltula sp. TS41687]
MGRELQKKKNRSSLPKVRQKPRSKKVVVQGNAIIASQWNRAETLSQNYRRLGLAARLNGVTGGTERKIEKGKSVMEDVDEEGEEGNSLAIVGGAATAAALGRNNVMSIGSSDVVEEVRVERDERGRIVKVIRSGAAAAEAEEQERRKRKRNPLGDPLNDLDDDDDEEEEEEEEGQQQQREIGKGRMKNKKKQKTTTTTTTTADRGVIPELEKQASRMVAPPRVRKQSVREEEWIRALVDKHADDVRAMFWDRKLNPRQQSEGDIRWRVESWKKNRRRKVAWLVRSHTL